MKNYKMDETARAKCGLRIDPLSRANMTFDLMLTNKPQCLIACEYGVSRSSVSRFVERIRKSVRAGNVRIRFYYTNGVPMFRAERKTAR